MLKVIGCISFISVFACSPNSGNVDSGLYDTSRIAILPTEKVMDNLLEADTALTWLKGKTAFKWKESDLRTIDSILIEAIRVYNLSVDTTKPKQVYLDLEDYKRQYVFYFDKQSHRRVWINCFCKDIFRRPWSSDADFEWKTSVVLALDGGSCFFNSLIDLTTKEKLSFIVNDPG